MSQLALDLTQEAAPEPTPPARPVDYDRINAARLRDHEAAMRQPKPGFEAAIVRLYGGMADYAEAHSKRYESALVTADYVIGDAWERMGNALHDLLNGETGRLDCGTLSASIYKLIEGGGSQSAIAAVRAETQPPKPESTTIGIGRSALSPRQRELLGHVRVENNLAVYTSEERIPDWGLLKRIMLALGGAWKTGGKKTPGGFRFPDDLDAAELVRLAKETGEITDPKVAEFFPTPRALADLVVERARLDFFSRILEPSAGLGAIAQAARASKPSAHVVCVEALEASADKLRDEGFDTTCADFLSVTPAELNTFTHILMNPPFSKRQDIQHVRHAYTFLEPGGTLVSIMSSGVQFRDDKLAKEFRAFVAANDGEIWSNPPGSFEESGTSVNTCMVRIRRAS